MTTLGVHFALTSRDAKLALAPRDPDEIVELITETLEEKYLASEKWSFQLDKAWDALHRSLTDGRLLYATGPFPLAYAVLGGRPLDAGDDFTACFVEPSQVADAAKALAKVEREWLRSRYFELDPREYGAAPSEKDFDYTWSCFRGLPEFFARAARARRAVLFTTDA